MPSRLLAVAAALALAVLAGLAAAALTPAAAAAAGTPPWRAAERLRAELFAAQSALITAGPAEAARKVARARAGYGGELRAGVLAAGPDADAAARSALSAAARAARAGDPVALAAARGASRAAVLRGAYAAALAAAGRTDPGEARSWLLLRDFRTATRFTRAGADATTAVAQLEAGRLSPRLTRAAIAKDLLDAYQARLRELLDDAAAGIARGLPVRAAEAAGQAEGYFALLRLRYTEDRGEPAARRAAARFAALRRAAIARTATPGQVAAAAATLDGFTAAPFTAEEAARRAQQLLRFLALVPVEYGRGVDGTRVTLDFEIQEAVAFAEGGAGAFADLADGLARRDPARTARARDALAQLRRLVDQAAKTPERVAPEQRVQSLADRTHELLAAAMPPAWTAETDESDHDLIALTLDRMETAVAAGRYGQAEQARLEAYAFFEFGPERRLQAFDPGLATEVEELVWFGAGRQPGLARLIADRAPRRAIRQARLALDERLAESAATLGDAASRTTVVTNAAIIVFREGLEAVLILAAITASFAGARRRLRRPVLAGAALGLLVSVATWVLAQTLLTSLERYGEKLEAVVGLVAIGVLLLITNWFFHKVYGSEWIGRFHRRRKRLEGAGRVGFLSAQALGLGLLGLTSVYREGFETVLFLQSLELSAGAAAVLEGAGLGLALTLAVAVATFALQRKLPYKRMLVVTGVLIGVVLVVMVGQTARTMQGTGWLPITSVDLELASWLGLWLGVFPTVETLGAQAAAMAFVLGSYWLAQELRVRRPRRRAAAQEKRGSSVSNPAQGSEPDSREPATSQTEPASVMAASTPPARGA